MRAKALDGRRFGVRGAVMIVALLAAANPAGAAATGSSVRYREVTGKRDARGFAFTVKDGHAEEFAMPEHHTTGGCQIPPASVHDHRFVAGCTVREEDGSELITQIHGHLEGTRATGSIRQWAAWGSNRFTVFDIAFEAREGA